MATRSGVGSTRALALCVAGALAIAGFLLLAALFGPQAQTLVGMTAVTAAALAWKRNRLTRRQLLGGALVVGGFAVAGLAFWEGYIVGNIASEQSPVVLEWVSVATVDVWLGDEEMRALVFDRPGGTYYVPLWKLLAGYALSVAGVLVAVLPLPERLTAAEANR